MTGREVIKLPIDQIGELKPGEILGLIDAEAIDALVARLPIDGLQTPIWVRRNGNARKGEPFSVVAGRHRLRAARALGWSEIEAEVRAGPSSKPSDLKTLQLIENIDRRVPRPIELACFIMARWTDVAASMEQDVPSSPQTAAIRARWNAVGKLSSAAPTAPKEEADAGVWASVAHTGHERRKADAEVASLCGFSARKVRQYRQIFEKLVEPYPDLFADLNAHPMAERYSHMRQLAAIRRDSDRRKVIEKLLSKRDWQSMDEALRAAIPARGDKGAGKSPHSRFKQAWQRMEQAAQREHALWLAETVDDATAKELASVLRKRGRQ